MRTIDYQQHIAECARQAELAPNPQARIQWRRMEDFWRMRCAARKPFEGFSHFTLIEPETKTPSPGNFRAR